MSIIKMKWTIAFNYKTKYHLYYTKMKLSEDYYTIYIVLR